MSGKPGPSSSRTSGVRTMVPLIRSRAARIFAKLDRSDRFQWHQLNAFDMTIRRAGRVSSVGSGKSRVPDST